MSASPTSSMSSCVAGKVQRAEESLFYYVDGETFYTYRDLSFTPTFLSDLNVSQETRDLCGGDTKCMYDVIVTGMASLLQVRRLYYVTSLLSTVAVLDIFT